MTFSNWLYSQQYKNIDAKDISDLLYEINLGSDSFDNINILISTVNYPKEKILSLWLSWIDYEVLKEFDEIKNRRSNI